MKERFSERTSKADDKSAKVWIQQPMYGNNYFALIEIKAVADNQSRLEFYCIAWKGWCNEVEALFTAEKSN